MSQGGGSSQPVLESNHQSESSPNEEVFPFHEVGSMQWLRPLSSLHHANCYIKEKGGPRKRLHRNGYDHAIILLKLVDSDSSKCIAAMCRTFNGTILTTWERNRLTRTDFLDSMPIELETPLTLDIAPEFLPPSNEHPVYETLHLGRGEMTKQVYVRTDARIVIPMTQITPYYRTVRMSPKLSFLSFITILKAVGLEDDPVELFFGKRAVGQYSPITAMPQFLFEGYGMWGKEYGHPEYEQGERTRLKEQIRAETYDQLIQVGSESIENGLAKAGWQKEQDEAWDSYDPPVEDWCHTLPDNKDDAGHVEAQAVEEDACSGESDSETATVDEESEEESEEDAEAIVEPRWIGNRGLTETTQDHCGWSLSYAELSKDDEKSSSGDLAPDESPKFTKSPIQEGPNTVEDTYKTEVTIGRSLETVADRAAISEYCDSIIGSTAAPTVGDTISSITLLVPTKRAENITPPTTIHLPISTNLQARHPNIRTGGQRFLKSGSYLHRHGNNKTVKRYLENEYLLEQDGHVDKKIKVDTTNKPRAMKFHRIGKLYFFQGSTRRSQAGIERRPKHPLARAGRVIGRSEEQDKFADHTADPTFITEEVIPPPISDSSEAETTVDLPTIATIEHVTVHLDTRSCQLAQDAESVGTLDPSLFVNNDLVDKKLEPNDGSIHQEKYPSPGTHIPHSEVTMALTVSSTQQTSFNTSHHLDNSAARQYRSPGSLTTDSIFATSTRLNESQAKYATVGRRSKVPSLTELKEMAEEVRLAGEAMARGQRAVERFTAAHRRNEKIYACAYVAGTALVVGGVAAAATLLG